MTNKYKVNGKEKINLSNCKTKEKGEFASKEEASPEFAHNIENIKELQQKLYAERKEGVIFIFQAMDAAGKDGAIGAVFGSLTPHGVKEHCFKVPSKEELSHDYLWRFWSALPPKGEISIFNRSYYEDVLVGKVHKLYLSQSCADRINVDNIINKRYSEINNFEKYLFDNSIRVVKIFLNISNEEQAKRFISRVDIPEKHWKVSEGDIKEREYWDEYQKAYEIAINRTSTPKSPWYVVPADKKWYARLIVSRIVLETLRDMNPQYPTIEDSDFHKFAEYRQILSSSLDKPLS